MLKPEFADRLDVLTTFTKEGQLMKTFHHPNIVKFAGAAEEKHPDSTDPSDKYLLVELVKGGSLGKLLALCGARSSSVALVNNQTPSQPTARLFRGFILRQLWLPCSEMDHRIAPSVDRSGTNCSSLARAIQQHASRAVPSLTRSSVHGALNACTYGAASCGP
jgi:serine/threonine protein kinase